MNLDRLCHLQHRSKCKTKITKLPEDKLGGNIDDLGLSKDILDTTSKVQSIK